MEAQEPSFNWIPVECTEDVPLGVWLVRLDTDDVNSQYQVMDNRENVAIIGDLFHFDCKNVIAYCKIKEFIND